MDLSVQLCERCSEFTKLPRYLVLEALYGTAQNGIRQRIIHLFGILNENGQWPQHINKQNKALFQLTNRPCSSRAQETVLLIEL